MHALAHDLAPSSLRKSLSSNQLALLRRLGQHGAAGKVKGGWFLGGQFHRLASFTPLIAKGLCEPTFRFGRHRLELTPHGRTAYRLLDPSP